MNCYVRLGSLSVRSSRSGSRLAARPIGPVSSVQVFGNSISRERERERESFFKSLYILKIDYVSARFIRDKERAWDLARTHKHAYALSFSRSAGKDRVIIIVIVIAKRERDLFNIFEFQNWTARI